jgi:hypothetical protein
MKIKLLKILLAFNCAVILCASAKAQSPVFNSFTANTLTPAKLGKFELNINLNAGFTNAYDYNDIDVQCIFFAPGGRKDTVDGFFIQDYILNGDGSLTASGSGTFKVRYAPNETGTWSYILSCTNSLGTATQPSQTFQCVASSSAGFIRKNTSNYLNFDNGSQYIPIGENMGWQDNNVVTDYTNWLTSLSANNGNFIRVWMSSWAFALEWKNGTNGFSGLKKYKQTSAYYLDWLLDYCKQKNVYMMLTLNNHGQVSSTVNPEWIDNPYNAANGGPATNTWDFFGDLTAKATLKNRLRYIIARYGYSQNIESWELFNEVDWTDQFATYKSTVSSWDNEMAAYIKSKDVYQHLITTSYAYDYDDPATWSLSNIDFSQTHYYVSSPNIESVLSSGAQNYLSSYLKPTLNGEFGLGPSGPTLITDDPNGVHIHNAIWGSLFGGGMGGAMSWWWDDYIAPQNLYYHFKPLAVVTSLINFENDNYKKTAVSTSGGGASDIIITPGANFGAATSSSFSIDANGTITPGTNQLGQYLFGSVFNTQYHNPPSFSVIYPVSGQFKVTTGSSIGTSPQINIYADGALMLSQSAVINSTYTVSISAGAHVIKVDNLGTDWTTISNYTFTNIGSPVTAYVLKSANTYKAAGWLLNSKYNWQYLQSNGAAPPVVTGSNLSITGMHNGTYTVSFYSTSTGSLSGTSVWGVTTGTLTIPLPNTAWDLFFTAVENSVLPVQYISFTGNQVRNTNCLYINISNADNVKTLNLERSADGINFNSINVLSNSWSTFVGKHEYIDDAPIKGANFYRLKTIDKDGKGSYSANVKLVNNLVKFGIHPNPVKDKVVFYIDEGKYITEIFDQSGKNVSGKTLHIASNSQIEISVDNLSHGIYYLSVCNEKGNEIANEKFIK